MGAPCWDDMSPRRLRVSACSDILTFTGFDQIWKLSGPWARAEEGHEALPRSHCGAMLDLSHLPNQATIHSGGTMLQIVGPTICCGVGI